MIAALAGVEPARSEGIAAYGRFADRIAGLVAERVERPGSDLVSGIARGRTATGEALPETEIPSFIALLLVAGGETTDRALVNFLAVLMGEPDVRSRGRTATRRCCSPRSRSSCGVTASSCTRIAS